MPTLQHIIETHEYCDLLQSALKATRSSYAPYSKINVGAALLTTSGKIYTGCNVENASFGLTVCAERNAIFQAITAEGPTMRIVRLAVFTNNLQPIPPCGACRQVITEFCNPVTPTIIYFSNEHGLFQESINALLPHSFVFPK